MFTHTFHKIEKDCKFSENEQIQSIKFWAVEKNKIKIVLLNV